MSLMAILASYNAVARGNNAQYAMMQNNQARMGLMRGSSTSFGSSAALAAADNRFAVGNAQAGLEAKVSNVQLDSMEKARDSWAKSFNYFA